MKRSNCLHCAQELNTMSQPTCRILAPKISSTLSTETEPKKRGQTSIRVACQYCRKKRLRVNTYRSFLIFPWNCTDLQFVQCDGREPCFRCRKDGVDCTYRKRQGEAIANLLAENERLKKDNAEKDKLLQTINYSHDVETCIRIIDKLKEGNKSRQDVLQAMASKQNKNNYFQINSAPKEAATTELPNSDIGPAICPICSCRLRPWNFPPYPSHFERSANAIETLSAGGMSIPVSLPSFSASGDTTKSRTDVTA